jgi:hypothetical protein
MKSLHVHHCLACNAEVNHHHSYLHQAIFCNKGCAADYAQATIAYFLPYDYGRQTLGFIRDMATRSRAAAQAEADARRPA